MIRALIVALAIVIGASCLVDRRTPEYTCGTSTDCGEGRVCDSGYCVIGDRPDECPEACNAGCNLGQDECRIVCNAVTDCGAVRCPAGFACDITCDGPGACQSITCEGNASCSLTCITEGSCGNIDCGSGYCDVSCDAPGSCGSITCQDACACDVDCGLGDCGAQSCPQNGGCIGPRGACDSASCDRC